MGIGWNILGEQRKGFGNNTKTVATNGFPMCPAPFLFYFFFYYPLGIQNGRQFSDSRHVHRYDHLFDFRIAPRRGEVLDGILPIPFWASHPYP